MSAPQTEDETRRRLNPLFNDNKLKLGLFGVNVSNGCAITTAEDRHTVSWSTNLAIAQTADRYGYEAMVPVARWRGFGGKAISTAQISRPIRGRQGSVRRPKILVF
jgi:hypothetical protein